MKIRRRRTLRRLALAILSAILFDAGKKALRRYAPHWIDGRPVAAHSLDAVLEQAELEWNAKLARQSQTIQEAVIEYQRRYHRAPPPGFAEWFQFAQEHGTLLPDEYDTMMASLEPFWALDSVELRERTVHMGLQDSFTLVVVHSNFTLLDSGEDEHLRRRFGVGRAAGFQELIRPLLGRPGLDTMAFAINELAEPRVLTPWREWNQISDARISNSTANLTESAVTFDDALWGGDGTGGSTWSAFVRTCPPGSKSRRYMESMNSIALGSPLTRAAMRAKPSKLRRAHPSKLHGPGLDFELERVSASHQHLCDNPQEALRQGLFYSDFRNVEAIVPIFSPSTASGYADIVIPSHFYYARGFASYHLSVNHPMRPGVGPTPVNNEDAPPEGRPIRDEELPPWEERKGRIYWRGSPTGGGNNPKGQQLAYQRQRFLSMIANSTMHFVNITLSRQNASTLPPAATVASRVLHEQFFDVAFTSLDGCGPEEVCEVMKQGTFRFAEPVSPLHIIYNKMLLDLDGMAYSARFMALMESGSAVLKSTIFTEYFADMIQPWYHYIPLSRTYEEIYNIYAYFLGPEHPKRKAKHHVDHSSPEGAAKGCDNLGANDRKLARIGRSGRQWQSQFGSHAAMQVYTYRLLLEWSRLWSRDGSRGIGTELIFEPKSGEVMIDNPGQMDVAEGLLAAEKRANKQMDDLEVAHQKRTDKLAADRVIAERRLAVIKKRAAQVAAKQAPK